MTNKKQKTKKVAIILIVVPRIRCKQEKLHNISSDFGAHFHEKNY